jgi:predicted nuclease of predicted toxin-antitoxin system
MRFLIDVNLPPPWVAVFASHGFEAVHWTSVGNPRALDDEIMQYARDRGYVVFTHDLDFGALLALTRATGPSVLQVRAQSIFPSDIGELIMRVLVQHTNALESGALVSVDERSSRVRILPIR